MTEKVKLSVELEPGLRRRVRLAAASKAQSIRECVVNVIQRELENET